MGETTTSLALKTALAYYQAWTSHDLDTAMSYIADDIVCDAPAGRLEGAEAYRGFMGPFVRMLTSSTMIAAFGDDETALVMYDSGTVPVTSGRRVRHRQGRQDHPQPVCLRPGPVRRRTAGELTEWPRVGSPRPRATDSPDLDQVESTTRPARWIMRRSAPLTSADPRRRFGMDRLHLTQQHTAILPAILSLCPR